MNISERLLAAIGTGEDNAVPSKDLQALTGLTERELRKTIEQLRRSGHVIISCDRGYFLPETPAEVQRHIDKESRRARSIFYTLKSARELLKTMQRGDNNG